MPKQESKSFGPSLFRINNRDTISQQINTILRVWENSLGLNSGKPIIPNVHREKLISAIAAFVRSYKDEGK